MIDPLFEAFGGFLLPVIDRLNRRDVSQRLLWDLVIVSPNVAGEGVRQSLHGIEVCGRQPHPQRQRACDPDLDSPSLHESVRTRALQIALSAEAPQGHLE